MRVAINVVAAIALIASGVARPTRATHGQTKPTQRTYDLYFPTVSVPADAGIALVRIVISCGHVAAINRIPDDWYVRTLFPPHESEPGWKDFQFSSNAVDFEAGHGVARLRDLKPLQGAVTITVDEARCFDIVADIKDDHYEPTEGGWKVRLRKPQLLLRVHPPVAAPPNKSFNRSGGSVSRIRRDSANVLGIAPPG
jgi:hypothetical protein